MPTFRRRLPPGRIATLLVLLGSLGLAAAENPATEPPLPPGAGPVWDMDKAWSSRSATRERFCLNGLWRFRSHVLPEPATACVDTFDDARLSGWVLGSALQTCAVSCDQTVKKTGAAALRLDLDLPAKVNFYHLSKEVAVKPDTAYLLSAWVQTDFASGYVTLEVQDVRNRHEGKTPALLLSRASDRIAGKTAWQRVELDFRTPPGAERVRLYLRNYGGTEPVKGSAHLDDLRLQEKGVSLAGITPPADAAWGFCKVPGSRLDLTTYWHPQDPLKRTTGALGSSWFEREVAVPASWAGRRIVVGFDRVSTELTLFCNGQPAGTVGWFGGEIDLTPWAKPGTTVRLTALVRGLKPGDVSELFEDRKQEEYTRQKAASSILGDVWLDAAPAAGPLVGPFLIETRVQGMEIIVHAQLEHAAGAAAGLSLLCQVRDGERVVKEFTAPVAADATTVEARAAWPTAELWDLGKPRLYQMTVSLSRDGTLLDQSLAERFGFREFELRGKFFFLNGIKLNLNPCSYGIKFPYALDPGCIDRWLDRVISEGRNFVYTESVDSPNYAEGLLPVLRRADEKGILMAVTPMEFLKFWDRLDEPEVRSYYETCLRTRAQRVWNHPSLVLYRLNMNYGTYHQDQNPLLLSGEISPPAETTLGRRFAAASQSSLLMNGIDPTRRTYHHASGNMGDIYTLNNYLCWPGPQDLREWLAGWAQRGVKPLMMVEFDLPYPGSFQMLDPTSFWSNEPLMTEYGAILLGERSYALEDDDYQTFCDLAWNREKQKWGSSYGYFCSAVSPILDQCSAYYYGVVLPAWRTWGLSGGVNPWEYSTQRLRKREAKPADVWHMRVPPPKLPLPTDWSGLQRPGFAPDFFTYDCRGTGQINSYMFPGLPAEAEYLEPTQWGKVLPELLRPLYAYVAGPGADWPEQDHAYVAGETVRKSVVLLNDLRRPATFTVRWTALLDGRAVGGGTGSVTVPPAEKGQCELDFVAPMVATRTPGEIRAEVSAEGGAVPVAAFAFQVHPRAVALAAPAGWFIYDPVGRTSAALAAVGLTLPDLPEAGIPAAAKVLVIGSEALGLGERPAFFRDLPGRTSGGLQVLFCEQTAAALESWFGLRAFPRASRQVWIRDAAHPFVRGLSNPDLADWRGRTSLAPPDGPPGNLTDSQRQQRVWRCSQRGTVASTIVEKPHVGRFRPILDGEFDLRYMTLWEVLEGQGRLVFCQMDLSDRLGKEPAADRLLANLCADLRSWTPPPAAPAVLLGSDSGRQAFAELGFDLAVNPDLASTPADRLVILTRGCAPWVFRNRTLLKSRLEQGGRLLAAGLSGDDAAMLQLVAGSGFSLVPTTCTGAILAGPLPEPFRGVGPAEVHWRQPRTLLTVGAVPPGGWRAATGILARVPVGQGELLWISALPGDFDPAQRPDLLFTRLNTTRLLSLVLGNCGVRNGLAWTTTCTEERTPPALALPATWRARQDPDAAGTAAGWMRPEVDEGGADWVDLPVPGLWGETYPAWNGFLGDVWYRTRFAVPPGYAGLPLEFYAAAIDDTDEVWINGTRIGETTRSTPQWWLAERHYRIPVGVLAPPGQANVLAVRITNTYQDAGILNAVSLGIPPGLERLPARLYLDPRRPRDDPYAYMRW